ncbi:MAG: hypothetical protein KDA52_18740, partial [Planctomycetaceae bacterium]|nr:hypothetical protein [Planctomycetaceae bacterium]
FVDNTARAGGGAISNGATLVIETSTFTQNVAGVASGFGTGGAIENQSGGTTTLTNSTLSGNTGSIGGAISNSSTLNLYSTTIADNHARNIGGGVYSTGTSNVENTIIGDNTSDGNGPDVNGAINSLGHNLITDTTDSTGFGATGDLLNMSPQLSPLANFGGLTESHNLLPGSPAIDSASNATSPVTDQRGIPRPQGIGFDIGAVELAPPLIVEIDQTTISEGDGATATTVTITRTTDNSDSLDVILTSSDTSEATIVGTATIPAGESSVSVEIAAVDDQEIDGTQSVTIKASLPIELDDSFGGTGIVSVDHRYQVFPPHGAMAVQPDGKIITVTEHGDSQSWRLTRTNPDGTLDSTFGTSGVAVNEVTATLVLPVPYDILIQPDGKILVGGKIASGIGTEVLARFNPDGSFDTSFGTSGIADFISNSTSAWIEHLALLDDGRIMALMRNNGSVRGRLVRLNTNGSRDSTFGSAGIVDLGNATASAMQVLPNGQYLVALRKTAEVWVMRVNANGTIDSTFGTAGTHIQPLTNPGTPNGISIQSDGRIVVGLAARFKGSTADYDSGAFRLMPDGGLDTSYGDAGFAIANLPYDDFTYSMVMHPDGAVTFGGYTLDVNGDRHLLLVRFTKDGDSDLSIGPGGIRTESLSTWAGQNILNIERQPDGRLLAFVIVGGTDFRLLRYLGESALSASQSLDVTDDEGPLAPFILDASENGSDPNRSGIRELTMTFDQAVTLGSPTALNLFNHSTGMPVDLSNAV